jgi:hypothetical protein
MGSRKGVVELWPTYVQTVGLMKEHGTAVAAVCSKCRTWMKVDLDAIIQLRGRSFSLIDQQGPCRVWQCDGKAFFMWSPGRGVPMRALTSQRGSDARMFGHETATAPPEDDDPTPPQPPRPPRRAPPPGIDPQAWDRADERERKRLVRIARG